MNDAGTLPRHMLDVRALTPEAFAPYGQVIAPLRTGGQGAEISYDPEASAREAKLHAPTSLNHAALFVTPSTTPVRCNP